MPHPHSRDDNHLVRILVVTNLYPPIAEGGYELCCGLVVARLRERHDVHVLTSDQRASEAPPDPSIQRSLPLFFRGQRRHVDRAAGDPPSHQASPSDAGGVCAGADLHLGRFGHSERRDPRAPRPRSEVVLQINATLEELWKSQQLEPAPAADDEELMRRVYLDLAGRTPSVHEIRTYLADKSSQRYEQLVDRLLQSRDHASHLATTWRTFLIPEGVDLTAFGGIDKFDQWLADEFGKNASYDSVVRSLLLAGGRLSRSGPLLFYSAAKLDPDVLAVRSARVFLGMRLECAQCHNHPFEPWTQEEFWNLAAFFAQISRPQGELKAVSTVMQVHDVDHGDVHLPKSDTVIPPRFLNGGGSPDAAGANRVGSNWPAG